MERQSASTAKRILKQKLEQEFVEENGRDEKILKVPVTESDDAVVQEQDTSSEVEAQVRLLNSSFYSSRAVCCSVYGSAGQGQLVVISVVFVRIRKDLVDMIVDCGALPALVKNLQTPPYVNDDDELDLILLEVEKACTCALALIGIHVGVIGNLLHSSPHIKQMVMVLYSLSFVYFCNFNMYREPSLRIMPSLWTLGNNYCSSSHVYRLRPHSSSRLILGRFSISAARLGLPDTGSYPMEKWWIKVCKSLKLCQSIIFSHPRTCYEPMHIKIIALKLMNVLLKVSPKACGHTRGRKVVSREEAVMRIKADVDAREESGSDIVIVARTDSRRAVSLDKAL
ncbi:2,3-dimethylmalate lyase [Linum perenne]